MEISPTTPVIHRPDDRDSKRKQPGLWLFLALAIVYILTANGRIDSGDGQVIFDVSQRLLEHGSVALPPPDPDRIAFDSQGKPRGKAEELGIPDSYRTPGRGGHYYSPTGLGHSLLLIPFLALGKVIALITQANTPQWVMEFVAAMLFNPLVSSLSGLLIFLLGRRLSLSPRKSLALALIYAFGTMTWVYAKSFASDPLVALFSLLAFYSLVSYRYTQRLTWLWVGGASLGFAVLTKPFSLVNAPIFFVYLLLIVKDEPLRNLLTRLVILAIPFITGVALTMAYNWWRFESPFDIGYRDTYWSVPFLTGLYGLTLSPGKGRAICGIIPSL